jgi:hypothetical protein
MNVSAVQENEIISRFKNGQGIRAISRDMSLGRYVISRVIAQHVARTSLWVMKTAGLTTLGYELSA